MIWAVLDTNVLVSGLGWPDGPPGRIVEHALAGRFLMVTSSDLLDELGRALGYPKLARIFSDPLSLVLLIETMAIRVEPATTVAVTKDPDDNRVLEAAVEAKADYIVTGDDHLLELESFEGTGIVGPKGFLEILESP